MIKRREQFWLQDLDSVAFEIAAVAEESSQSWYI